MSLFKMKRGQESKINSLAKEDGSLIFSLDGANDSTLRLDQSVSGTVQRLGVAVDKAKDANSVIDYNESTRHIKIGYAGAGLSTANLTHIAGYTNNGTQIKDVSKDVLKSWLGASDSANKLNPTVTLTNEDNSTSGYRLIATISLNAWNNYRAVFITKSRHQGAGYLTITIGNNTNSITYDNAYSEITYWGPTGSGGVIASDAYQVRVSPDGKKAYVFWKYWDHSPTDIYVISSNFTISSGTWMTSIEEATYGKVKAYTSINNAQSLQGSSLSQILNAAGGSNAFTGLDTTTNNVVKLTRANGGTIQKIIDNVSSASSASYAAKAEDATNATNASTANYAKSAPPTANSVNYVRVYNSSDVGGSNTVTVNDLSKKHFVQGMINSATDNPLGKAGWVHVQSMAWADGSDQWASQIAFNVQNGTGAYYRSSNGSGHLAGRDWNKFLDSSNYTEYAADRTALVSALASSSKVTFTRANAGTFAININYVENALTANNANKLGGRPSTDYALVSQLSGDINALSAKRLPSYQSISVANSFFYRYGTAGNTSDGGAWTGFPSAVLYNAASTVNGFGNALYQKKVGVLHLAAGSSAHDLVFQAGGINGGIAYVATGRNPAYILDTLNYKDKAYTFNKLTASSTFTATGGVVIDGGSY